jgi:hypothetical protein
MSVSIVICPKTEQMTMDAFRSVISNAHYAMASIDVIFFCLGNFCRKILRYILVFYASFPHIFIIN